MIKNTSIQDLFQPPARNEQLLIIAQLLQQVPAMRNLDELFEWLARAIVRRFGVQVAQFWVTPGDSAAFTSLTLRALECQNERLVGRVLANEQVVAVASQVLRIQRHIMLWDVGGIFSAHQAAVLKRYGLDYCCGYFLPNVALLHTPQDRTVIGAPAAASPALAVLFLEQIPSEKALRDMRRILEQALLLARKHNLQLPPAWPAMLPSPPITPLPASSPGGK
jgi:hypothetical protein